MNEENLKTMLCPLSSAGLMRSYYSDPADIRDRYLNGVVENTDTYGSGAGKSGDYDQRIVC